MIFQGAIAGSANSSIQGSKNRYTWFIFLKAQNTSVPLHKILLLHLLGPLFIFNPNEGWFKASLFVFKVEQIIKCQHCLIIVLFYLFFFIYALVVCFIVCLFFIFSFVSVYILFYWIICLLVCLFGFSSMFVCLLICWIVYFFFSSFFGC